MNQNNFVKTNIDGVKILFENTITDERGTFFDLVENGFLENIYKGGIKHIYASLSKTKLVARGNHFHFENFENFYTLTGTALWVLLDCRETSSTYGNVFSFITSYEDYKGGETRVYSVKNNEFAHFTVPPMVYHLVAPLTDEPVLVVALGSTPFKKKDVGKPKGELMKKLNPIISKYGITIQN